MIYPRASEPERVPIRRLRCSKCGEEPVRLLESWHAYIAFEVKDGARSAEGHKHEDSPYLVTAECKCGHRWDLRCAKQITGVDRERNHGGAR